MSEQQLDSGYTLWQYKKDKSIVKAKFLRKFVLVQPVEIKSLVSDSLFDFLIFLTSTNHSYFGWYKVCKSIFYKYFESVPKLKQILLKEGFGI